MRRFPLLLVSALVGFPACAPDDAAGPDAQLITVRLRDEGGNNAGPNSVFLTDAQSASVYARTGSDGTARFRIQDPGIYRIWVVPRVGYLASATLTRDVRVSPDEHVVVDFTLFRASDNPGTLEGPRR